ncbi:MAG TPA: IS1182 family transposase [Rhodopila sp.]
MEELFPDLPHTPVVKPSPGAPRLRRAERHQVELQTISLDDLIGPDHLARLVWDMVQRFHLQPLLDQIDAREAAPGHPPADPAILVALWLYATLDGVGSARELARLCEHHHAYRWICGGVSTNHHTLSDFRLAHADWLDRELTRAVAGLMAAGEVDLATVAHDGMRVRAAAGGSSFRRKPRLEDLLAAAKARVTALKTELAHEPAARTRRQAASERAASERIQRIEAALAAVPQAEARKKRNKGKPEHARVSTTDAEARVMKMPDGGFRPAYNVQFAAETQHGLLTAVAVTNSGADQDALDVMHARVTQAYGRAPDNWLVDGGYVSQAGIEAVTARGSKLHAPLGTALARSDSPAIVAWRKLMASEPGKLLYRRRGQTIEWVNAGARGRGLYGVNVRGTRKVRAVALWHALAHNLRCILRIPRLREIAWTTA